MAERTPLVEAWIRYAESDWHDSQILASAGGNARSVCFHLQQCLEKLFKAELMRLELPVPKTHNLRELSELLHQVDDDWSAATIDLKRRSLAAVEPVDDRQVRGVVVAAIQQRFRSAFHHVDTDVCIQQITQYGQT